MKATSTEKKGNFLVNRFTSCAIIISLSAFLPNIAHSYTPILSAGDYLLDENSLSVPTSCGMTFTQYSNIVFAYPGAGKSGATIHVLATLLAQGNGGPPEQYTFALAPVPTGGPSIWSGNAAVYVTTWPSSKDGTVENDTFQFDITPVDSKSFNGNLSVNLANGCVLSGFVWGIYSGHL